MTATRLASRRRRGSRRAIARSRPDLGGLADGGARGRRRDRSAGAAGRRRRPHPHAGRQRRGAGPVLPGLRGGRVRRHDDLPRLQQPGHRVIAGGRAVAARRARASGARRTDGDSGGRLRAEPRRSAAGMDDPVAELPATDRRRACRPPRRSWSTTSGSMTRAVRGAARSLGAPAACSQVHCEDPRPHRRGRRDALAPATRRRGYHADYAPAVRRGRGDRTGRSPWPARRTRRSTSCTCPAREALAEVAAGGGARRPCLRRDVPALPGPDRRALRRADPDEARAVRDLAAAPRRRPTGGAVGGPRPTARSTWSRPTTSPTGSAVEKAGAGAASVRPDQQRRAGHRDAARDRLLRGRGDGPDHGRADGRPAGDDAGAALRAAGEGRDRGRPGRRPRAVRSGRLGGRSARRTSTTRATTRRTRASTSAGAVRSVVRPRPAGHPRRRVRRAPAASAASSSAEPAD